jgi:hypothetical protein
VWLTTLAEGRKDTMAITWRKDVDTALEQARAQGRHLLLDFSAAPM